MGGGGDAGCQWAEGRFWVADLTAEGAEDGLDGESSGRMKGRLVAG